MPAPAPALLLPIIALLPLTTSLLLLITTSLQQLPQAPLQVTNVLANSHQQRCLLQAHSAQKALRPQHTHHVRQHQACIRGCDIGCEIVQVAPLHALQQQLQAATGHRSSKLLHAAATQPRAGEGAACALLEPCTAGAMHAP